MLATILSKFAPWFFMAWGVLLVLKPNVFVRGHWKRTDIAKQLLSPKAYLFYTRCVGIFFIIAGLVWLFLQSAAESRRHTRNSIGVVTSASNQALERTAARRMFTFQMIKTVSVEATLAAGGGRSACSR